MAADGSIIIETDIDNKEAQKELNKLNKQIRSLEDQITSKKQGRLPLEENLDAVNAKLEEARKTLSILQDDQKAITAAMQPGATPEDYLAAYSDRDRVNAALKQQQAEVDAIEKEWKSADSALRNYDSKIIGLEGKLNRAKSEAGEIQKNLATANPATQAMAGAMDRMQKSAARFSMRLREVVRSALIFTAISRAIASFREWMGKVIKTNDEANKAFARLRGALLTLAQPLVNIIIPALTTLANILTRIISAASRVVSALFGTTAEASAEAAENLYNETEAMDGVGDAAEKAGKSLASFDQINQLSGSGGNSSRGNTSTTNTELAKPDFSFLDMANERLDAIANAVMAIGSGLALWKLSTVLPGQLSGLLKQLAGITIAIGGLILMWDGLTDAWDNGVDWSNLIEILGGATIAALGLYAAFGKIGAGISLVLSGIAMLVTGFKDVIDNGANLQNTLLIIAGIIATGLGISFLAGTTIPALVAAIMSVIYAIVAWQGNAEELAQNLKIILGGIVDFVAGVFTLDWERAWKGVKDVFRGLINSVIIIFESVVNGIISGLNFLIDKINSLSWEIPEWVPGIGGETFGFNVPKIPKLTLPRVPELARGAVIPPNREFLAVLGDQKQGTNIETPLNTMVQAFKQALSQTSMGYGGDQTVILQVDKDQLGKVVYRLNKAETRRIGVNLAGV